jgi:hypothetical protein
MRFFGDFVIGCVSFFLTVLFAVICLLAGTGAIYDLVRLIGWLST